MKYNSVSSEHTENTIVYKSVRFVLAAVLHLCSWDENLQTQRRVKLSVSIKDCIAGHLSFRRVRILFGRCSVKCSVAQRSVQCWKWTNWRWSRVEGSKAMKLDLNRTFNNRRPFQLLVVCPLHSKKPSWMPIQFANLDFLT